MWIDLPRLVVVAHRGDKTHAPENTLVAFTLAAEKGADAIEFDAKLTADGKVVIIHDQTVDRTTNRTGKISDLSLASLRDLDAGGWFSREFCGEKIPTLDEVFELLGKRVYMNVELTNYGTPFDELVPSVVELVKQHRMEERVLFSSFFPHNLSRARRLLPRVPCALLTKRGWLGSWGRSFGWRGNYFAFHPYLTDATPGLIRRVQKAGKRVHVWPVNTQEDLQRVISFGVDGIITGDPGLALGLLGRKK